MNIEFQKIILSNFMSFGYADIDLSEPGFTLVSGVNKNVEDSASSNGSGKSSIWEAISWVLTGNTIRGCKNVSNSNGDDGALVELTCKIDGKEYIITRTKDHSKLKSSLRIFIDGVDKSGKGIRDTEKLLAEYLPDITASLIGSVIILGQGLPQRFTSNTPSGRKEVLEKLSNSDFMIEDIKNRINQRIINFNKDKKETEDVLIKYTTQKEMCETAKQQIEIKLNNLENVEELQDELIAKNILIDQVTSDKSAVEDRMHNYQLDKDLANSEMISLFNDKSSNEGIIRNRYDSEINNLLNQVNAQQLEVNTLESEIKRKDSIIDVCPTCGQKLQGVEKPDTVSDKIRLKDKEILLSKLIDAYYQKKIDRDSEIDNTNKGFDAQISTKQAKISECETNISLLAMNREALEAQLQEYISQKVRISNQIKSYDEQATNLKSELSNVNEQIGSLDSKILYNNNVIKDISAHLDILNKLNTAVKRDFRGILLRNVIDFLNKRSKEYCNDVFNHSNIEFMLDGNNIAININNKEYEQLSGGEKQKVDIIIQLAIRDMLCKYMDFSSNIFVLDEIFDNLDDTGSEKILNLLSKRLEDVSSIYIVTHHSSIQIPVDRELLIVKDSNGISRIEI